MEKERLLAVIWDFDGTIADTRERNLDVTRSVIRAIGKEPGAYAVLQNKEIYTQSLLAFQDWREFYLGELGMTPDETELMGSIWGECQLRSQVEQDLYPGVDEVIRQAAGIGLPQAIFSVNSEHNIRRILEKHSLSGYFSSIVGHEQLNGKGKPDPEGLIRSLYQLGILDSSGAILYIGDHKTDILAAEAANHLLDGLGRKAPLRIESVHASYVFGNNLPAGIVPDRKAEKPSDITAVIMAYTQDDLS